MKLVRYGNPGKEKPGLIDADGKLRDLSAVIPDLSSAYLGDAMLAKLRRLKTDSLPLVKGKPRMGCPCRRCHHCRPPQARRLNPSSGSVRNR